VTALRVLHVAQSSEYGLARYLASLLEDQQAAGWELVMAGDPASALVPRIPAGVRWVDWRASRDPGPSVAGEVRALARIVRAVEPDVVHLHSSKAGLAGRLALRGRRPPVIFQPHSWSWFAVDGRKRAASLAWERAGARWAEVVLCCSESERAEGAAAGVRPRAWRVVTNAVDVERFSPGPSSVGVGSGDGPVVVCAGRLTMRQKGQDVLLQAWPVVIAEVPTARLVFVGDGPDRAALESLARGLAGVSFAGEVPEVVPWLRAATVVAQPSRYEGLSLSVLEALACGKPVVATDAVGMREVIADAGAVVPLEDSAALAAALVIRLRDPARVAAEGERARERAVSRYSRSAWRESMLAVTAEAAADSLAPPG
jgi:glycosyltransferase involved in cell wall biosynthesis